MRSALRTHVNQRREEIELDPAFTPIGERTLRMLAITGLGTAAVTTAFLVSHAVTSSVPAALLTLADILGAMIGVACTVGAIVAKPRSKWLKQFGQSRLDFWNGKWGERLTRLAGLGLKRSAISSASLSQHTEIALGRATDALFEALPKKVRRDLKAVPSTVRRLETDASALRESLDKLDELLARGDDPELRRQRDHAAEKVADNHPSRARNLRRHDTRCGKNAGADHVGHYNAGSCVRTNPPADMSRLVRARLRWNHRKG